MSKNDYSHGIPRHANIGKIPKWKEKEESSKKNGLHAPIHMMNGDIYLGQWKNNLKDGDGTYYYKNGRIYEGEWKENKRNGYGTYSVAIDDELENNKNSFNDGENKLIPTLEELSFLKLSKNEKKNKKNELKNDVPVSSKLRKVYAGDWKDDQRFGHGVYFYKDGTVYEGEWEKNMREGWGRISYADGSKYEGEWHKEMRHGQGILLLPNGDRYEGMWLNDMKEGPGKFIYKNKRQCYEGEWAKNLPKFGTVVDFPFVEGIGFRKFPLPPLRLVDPASVLLHQHELIVEERTQRTISTT
ncbi:hypothetical protein HDU92_004297 [Lobulomyces angularis]|nr:hypothetical protein HDU92_004297 [Lobulomyces angularis]